jgi:CubicO group peptidase (beta-lactamase class C family)
MRRLLIVLLLASAAHAQLTVPKNPTKAQLAAALDPAIDDLVRKDAISGVVLVARDNDVLYERAVGAASRRYNVPNRTSTRFNLASVTKQFTRVAIGQLAQAGKLAITDPLIKHLPNYPNKEVAQKVTLQHLLNHTSGLEMGFGEEFRSASPLRFVNAKAWIDLLADNPLRFEPGKGELYSNYGYILLGEVIASVSGKSYDDYIRENVFARAGMTESGFHRNDAIDVELAIGHTSREGDAPSPMRESTLMQPVRGSAAGGSYSTARDLFRFTRALREHRLLQPEWTRWTYTRGTEPVAEGGSAIASGAAVAAGGGPGVNVIVASDGTWSVVVMSNLDPPGAQKFGPEVLRALNGDTSAPTMRMRPAATTGNAPAAQPAAATPPAMTALNAWISSFNTHDTAARKEFMKKSSLVDEERINRNSEIDGRMRAENGNLAVARVVSATETAVTAELRYSRSGAMSLVEITVEPQPPHRIVNVTLRKQ